MELFNWKFKFFMGKLFVDKIANHNKANNSSVKTDMTTETG
jgi:hypothetical protein